MLTMRLQVSSRTSPAMEKALALLAKKPETSKDVLMELGLSRASAYIAIKKSKENKPAPAKVKAKPKPKKVKAEPVEKRSFGIVPMDEIPDRLRKLPKLTLEGIHLPDNGKYTPKGIIWSSRVYVGVCPSCVGKVNLFKRLVGHEDVQFSGVCAFCDMRVTLSRDE